ncbi:transposase IS4 [Fusibacter sp. 3D3]|nr:transposase IS4 [Fusibacter sp. 3D3]
MDRGFYSEDNINALYQNHLKFLISTKVSLKYVQQELDKVRENIRTPGSTLRVCEVTKKQADLYITPEVTPPNTL